VILSLLLAATLAQNDARLLTVVGYIGSAEMQLAQTPGNGEVLKLLVSASRSVDECRFVLLGVNPRNEADPEANERWAQMTEADRHAYGWFHCDRAAYGLFDAKNAARKAGAKDARDRWIRPAIQQMLGLDRTVPINDLPDTVFGPHGHMGSFRALLFGLVYLRDHAESIMLVDYSHGFNTGWGQYQRVANALHYGAAYWAGTRGEELGLICRVMKGFEYVEVEAPEAYHVLFNYSKLSDSWLNANRATWRTVEIKGRCQ
jgi:hypothetical protein